MDTETHKAAKAIAKDWNASASGEWPLTRDDEWAAIRIRQCSCVAGDRFSTYAEALAYVRETRVCAFCGGADGEHQYDSDGDWCIGAVMQGVPEPV